MAFEITRIQLNTERNTASISLQDGTILTNGRSVSIRIPLTAAGSATRDEMREAARQGAAEALQEALQAIQQ